MTRTVSRLATAGFDGIAIKPASQSLERVNADGVDTVVVDFEGREHLPEPTAIERLSASADVVLTAPVRADGFDPLGDARYFGEYEPHATFALVAGNGAYLTGSARRRAIAPRLSAALRWYPDSWVGTEGIERLALATGATQYELLSPGTTSVLTGLRTAGFEGELAVYAPTVVTDERHRALTALEAYLRRRSSVRRALDNGLSDDEAEHVLRQAMDDYALVGGPHRVGERIAELKSAGATAVIGYPAGPA